MDEVLEKFNTTVTVEDNSKQSNFDGLYKNWGRLGNQEERRRELLDIQRSNRNTKLDKFRGILDIVQFQQQHNVFNTYKTRYRPNIYVAGFSKTSSTYSDVLMLSEWMVEKPEDLHEEWYITPCPKGLRMLVVASDGITKCYTKYGHFRFECRTELPGGNPCSSGNRNQYCILDCFYYDKLKTMFVLDLLAWHNQPMTDGETEFRHYWLESKFMERSGLQKISKKNKLIFEILPKIPCTPKSLNEFMMKHPHFENNQPPLDGLLFFHKGAHYTSGETPLVGWLFPYMVPEVLGEDITVHEEYMLQKPKDYVNQAEFIQQFEKKYLKKNRRGRRSNAMDTTEPITNKVTETPTESAETIAESIAETIAESIAESIVESSSEPKSEEQETTNMEEDISITKEIMDAEAAIEKIIGDN